MVRPPSPGEIARQVRAISDLSREELIERWIAAHGRPPPKGASRRLLERAAAYHLQATAFGGLKPAAIRKLSRLAGAAHADERNSSRGTTRHRLSPGTRLVREWNGRPHTVEVTDNGFLWNGHTWRSLSAVASAITGARWSGPRFFGL